MLMTRDELEKRWTCSLTIAQKQVWSVCALLCPPCSNTAVRNCLDGRELFILCNLPAPD